MIQENARESTVVKAGQTAQTRPGGIFWFTARGRQDSREAEFRSCECDVFRESRSKCPWQRKTLS